MLRPAVAVLADPGLGEFREADGEIQLGVGIIGGPPLPAGFAAAARVRRTAEVEAVAEALGLGDTSSDSRGTEAAEAAAELRGRSAGEAQHQREQPRTRVSSASPAERPVVLLHQLPELLGHFVRAGEDDGVGGFRLAPEAELETLQPFGDRRLQTRQLLDVLVDARVVELPQRAQDLVELARIDVLGRQVTPQRLQLAGLLADFAAQLADVLLGQAPVAIVPSTAPAAAPVGAAPCAAVEAVADAAVVEIAAAAAGLLAVSSATCPDPGPGPGLGPALTLALTLTLTLPWTFWPSTLLTLTVLGLLLPLLALPLSLLLPLLLP